jgi:hypothetical protein
VRSSIPSSYLHQLFYIPNLSYIGSQICCSIASYCIIQGQIHGIPGGATDDVTAEFTPTTLYGSPYALITGAQSPNDYLVLPVGVCVNAQLGTPSDTSNYSSEFTQFCSVVQ